VAAGDDFSDSALVRTSFVAMASGNLGPVLYGIVDDKGTYRPHQRVALPADTVTGVGSLYNIEGLALGNSDGQPCAYVLAEHKVECISWPDGKVADYAMDPTPVTPGDCGTGNQLPAGVRNGMVSSGDDLFLLGEHGCWFGPNGIVSIKACCKPPCAIEPLLGWKKTKRTPVDDPVSTMTVRKSTGEMYMSTCGVSGGAGCTIFKVTPDGKWAVHAEGLYSLQSEWGYSGAGYMYMAVDDNNGDLYIRANVLEGEGAAARRVSRLLLVEGNCTEPCPVSVVYDPKRDQHAGWPAALAEGSGGPMVVHGGYLFISAGSVVYRVGIGAL
jgi:hypothetical protein